MSNRRNSPTDIAAARLAQASRDKQAAQPTQEQPQPGPQVDKFETIFDPIIKSVPSVRELLIGSAANQPQACLQTLAAIAKTPPEQRQPIQLTHQLNLIIDVNLFLEVADEMREAAKKALGL